MKKILFNLIWTKGSGKDTFYKILTKIAKEEFGPTCDPFYGVTYDIRRFAFADKLKDQWIKIYNNKFETNIDREWLEQNKESVRKSLQAFWDYKRKDCDNYFIDNVFNKVVDYFERSDDCISDIGGEFTRTEFDLKIGVITDCRFKIEAQEINKLKDYWIEVVNIRIEQSIDTCTSELQDSHSSEQEVFNIDYDHLIANDKSYMFGIEVFQLFEVYVENFDYESKHFI